jgi:hypothetical protein
MVARFAASILLIALPLALGTQSASAGQDAYQPLGSASASGTEAGQRHMQREEEMADRRRRSEFARLAQLERTEGQRQMERRRRQIEEQRRQLLNLQSKSEAQRAAIQ